MPLLLVAGFLLPFDGSSEQAEPVSSPGEVAYRALPALPLGASERGRGGVEESAIQLAAALKAVPVAEDGAPCATDDLEVVWEKPTAATYRHGAVVEPLGPAPDAATEQVNGAVVCSSAPYAYMGFEATWDGEAWDVVAVPFIGDSEHDLHEVPVAAPAPDAPQVPTLGRTFAGAGIEGYASYEPQRTCDPTAKVGTLSMQRMLLNGNPGSRNLGISRNCGSGGTSEHKEGRAFDWGVYVTNAREKAQAQSFIDQILATDAAGNRHALARRMGVMYVIWNRQIWSAYRAGDGWRPYSGASAHTDHVHISLSWAGALGRTSFWSGTVPADLVAMPSSATVPAASRRSGSGSDSAAASARRGRSRTSTTEAHRRWQGAGELTREELRRRWEADPEAARRELEERYGEWGERVAKELERRSRRERDRADDRDEHDDDGDERSDDTTSTTTPADRAAAWQERRRQYEERMEAERAARRARQEAEQARRRERSDDDDDRDEERDDERDDRREEAAPEPSNEDQRRAERRAEYERRVREAIEAAQRRRREATPPTTAAPAPAPAPEQAAPAHSGGGRRRGRGGPGRWSPPTTAAPAPTTTAPPAPTTTAPPAPPTTAAPEAETTTTTAG